MKPGDIATALHSFHCQTTGQRGCVAGQRVNVLRRFRVNSGERVAVADPDSGEVLCWQVPVEWFQEEFGVTPTNISCITSRKTWRHV